jgi:hypothetical protein
VLIAVDNANKKLIVGLMQENVDRLLDDMPIEKRLGEYDGMPPELREWTLYVLGPEDLARFVARFGEVGGSS